ncbi:MAG: phosphatase PAP2 family protein [Edaphobacter sp.]|jgi:acid phosphatase (class A)
MTQRKELRILMFALFLSMAATIRGASQAPAQHPIANSIQPQPHVRVVGYLAEKEPDLLTMLPPYPSLDSIQDRTDVASLRQWQQPDNSPRWRLANEDVEMSYERFAPAFGMKINQSETPFLVHLLNRTEQDVQTVAFSAKVFYDRPRPYQRFQMEHVCGAEKAPAPEVPLKGGSSYPSGHTSFGWGAVLILAEVAPEHAQPLLARGREYGESRIICAVHYPSDIEGGQLVATAVVARLHADPEFEEDLRCAKEEHFVALHGGGGLSHACQQRKPQLGEVQAPAVPPLPGSSWLGCTGDAAGPSNPCPLSPWLQPGKPQQ